MSYAADADLDGALTLVSRGARRRLNAARSTRERHDPRDDDRAEVEHELERRSRHSSQFR